MEDNNDFDLPFLKKPKFFSKYDFHIVDNEKIQRPYDIKSAKNKAKNLHHFLPPEKNRYIIKETYKLQRQQNPNCVCGQGLHEGDKIKYQNLVYDKQRQIGFILGSLCIDNCYNRDEICKICKICEKCGVKNLEYIDGKKQKPNYFSTKEPNICVKCYNKITKEKEKQETEQRQREREQEEKERFNEIIIEQQQIRQQQKEKEQKINNILDKIRNKEYDDETENLRLLVEQFIYEINYDDYVVNIGKHKGKRYRDLDESYKEWICRQGIKFSNKNMLLYCLKSCNKRLDYEYIPNLCAQCPEIRSLIFGFYE
jgi:uncharacterized protein (DUF3820 family)